MSDNQSTHPLRPTRKDNYVDTQEDVNDVSEKYSKEHKRKARGYDSGDYKKKKQNVFDPSTASPLEISQWIQENIGQFTDFWVDNRSVDCFYIVMRGVNGSQGVFRTWEECGPTVNFAKGGNYVFKKFFTVTEGLRWMRNKDSNLNCYSDTWKHLYGDLEEKVKALRPVHQYSALLLPLYPKERVDTDMQFDDKGNPVMSSVLRKLPFNGFSFDCRMTEADENLEAKNQPKPGQQPYKRSYSTDGNNSGAGQNQHYPQPSPAKNPHYDARQGNMNVSPNKQQNNSPSKPVVYSQQQYSDDGDGMASQDSSYRSTSTSPAVSQMIRMPNAQAPTSPVGNWRVYPKEQPPQQQQVVEKKKKKKPVQKSSSSSSSSSDDVPPPPPKIMKKKEVPTTPLASPRKFTPNKQVEDQYKRLKSMEAVEVEPHIPDKPKKGQQWQLSDDEGQESASEGKPKKSSHKSRSELNEETQVDIGLQAAVEVVFNTPDQSQQLALSEVEPMDEVKDKKTPFPSITSNTTIAGNAKKNARKAAQKAATGRQVRK